jgi:hypothetical protein
MTRRSRMRCAWCSSAIRWSTRRMCTWASGTPW